MPERIKKITALWDAAEVGSHAAATAYYSIFSLAPLMLIVISLAGVFVGREGAQNAILGQFGETLGEDFRGFAEELLTSRDAAAPGIFATVVGAFLILLGASGIFGALRAGLDEIFENLPTDKKPGFWSALIDQLISIGMVLTLGFMLLASLLISTLLLAVGDYLHSLFPGMQVAAGIVDFVLSYGLISGFLILLIAFLPSKKIEWRPAIAGGFMAGALFVAGKYAIALYFSLAHPASAFGAASAMVVVVLWTYYQALGLFLSAILAKVFFSPSLEAEGASRAARN
jgi:membrane protein